MYLISIILIAISNVFGRKCPPKEVLLVVNVIKQKMELIKILFLTYFYKQLNAIGYVNVPLNNLLNIFNSISKNLKNDEKTF